jgi:hypothetical protein
MHQVFKIGTNTPANFIVAGYELDLIVVVAKSTGRKIRNVEIFAPFRRPVENNFRWSTNLESIAVLIQAIAVELYSPGMDSVITVVAVTGRGDQLAGPVEIGRSVRCDLDFTIRVTVRIGVSVPGDVILVYCDINATATASEYSGRQSENHQLGNFRHSHGGGASFEK